MKSIKCNILILLLVLLVASCQSDYTKLVNKELKSGVKNDDIFHGLKFGQTRTDFYNICWDLNSRRIATHGPDNNYVQTILYPQDTTQTTKLIRMLFYAKFSPDNIVRSMDVKFSYVAWAPWNTDLLSDKLLPKVQDTLMKWYPGNKFITVRDNILVKVDGNRQIQLAIDSDRDVSVLIEDLSYKIKQLKK